MNAMEKANMAGLEISQSIVYLMGGSFVLGSLFTIFLLLILDFMRAYKLEKEAKETKV